MPGVALWKALYTAGHDAAVLAPIADGWRLEGTAVYAHEGVPTRLTYALDLDGGFETHAGRIQGFVGGSEINLDIRRSNAAWTINGAPQPAANGLVDLDFGFTPATNHPQLRRMNLAVGETKEIVVAWMDVDSGELMPLPQIYRRTAVDAYDYNSPQGPYRATLRIGATGFVSQYPDLWEMVAETD